VPNERFQFTGEGGHQLAAALDTPDGPVQAYALFAHCFTCGKDVLAAKRIATALAARGIAVLRFDFTGLGSSEGEFANSTFSSNVADLVRAANHLRETRRAPTLLIGHSLGSPRPPIPSMSPTCSGIASRTSASMARWKSSSPDGRFTSSANFSTTSPNTA
jgi:pimeloyl-ACP methyl ester carboxylesterase